MCRAWIIAGALALAFAPYTHARAQAPLPLELQWRAPAECATEADVRAELARITRVRPGIELATVSAQVEIARSGQGYTLHLRSSRDGREGERRLDAADCRTLVRTATLVLALAFGPGVEVVSDANAAGSAPNVAGGGPNVASDAVNAGDAPAPEPRSESDGQQAQRAREVAPADAATSEQTELADDDEGGFSPDLALLVGGGAQLGLLPSAAFSLSAGAELSADALSVGLRATALPGVDEAIAQDVRARFDGLSGALTGCGDLWRMAWTLGVCGGARAGALRGRSSGATADGRKIAPWYALTTGAAVTWPREQPVRVRLDAIAGLSLKRPRFVIEGLGSVHQVPRVFAELSLLLVIDP